MNFDTRICDFVRASDTHPSDIARQRPSAQLHQLHVHVASRGSHSMTIKSFVSSWSTGKVAQYQPHTQAFHNSGKPEYETSQRCGKSGYETSPRCGKPGYKASSRYLTICRLTSVDRNLLLWQQRAQVKAWERACTRLTM